MRSCRGRLVWILLAVMGLLVVVAIASVAVYLILQRQAPAAGWQDPVAAVVPDQVNPRLALHPLAGSAELDMVDAAIAIGDLETAYSGLVFGLEPSDAQRIGRLILLGGHFAEAQELERAGLAYQQVYDLAVLSPRLNDPARADALLASGQGWAALGEKEQALRAYDQVYLIAAQSPYLQMANRRDLWAALEMAYRDLDEDTRADECRQAITQLDQQTAPHPPAASGEGPDLPLGEAVVSSEEVGVLEENRRQAAYALLQALPEAPTDPPTEPPADLVGNLAQALRAEDAAKLDLYSREMGGTTQPGKRIGVGWHMIRWLMLKLKVASRGFGLSLVPEWEAQVPQIQSELSKAYEGLFFDYEDLVTALPEVSLIGPGSYEVRRQAIMDGRLSRYPNYPAQQLAEKLQDAARELIASGSVDALYVDAQEEEGALDFFLSPSSAYGQASQSP